MKGAVLSLITSNPEDLKLDNNFNVELVSACLFPLGEPNNNINISDRSGYNVYPCDKGFSIIYSFDNLLYEIYNLKYTVVSDKIIENSTGADVIYVDNLDFYADFICYNLNKLGFMFVSDLRKNKKVDKRYRIVKAQKTNKVYSITININNKSARLLDASKIICASGDELSTEDMHVSADPHRFNQNNRSYCDYIVGLRACLIKKYISPLFYNNLGYNVTIGQYAIERLKSNIGSDKFNQYFPMLDPEIDKELRQAYRGGFTWINPKIAGTYVYNIYDFDVNSLYPYIPTKIKLPWGKPIILDNLNTNKNNYDKFQQYEDAGYPYILHCHVVASIKPDHIPCINIPDAITCLPNDYLEYIDNDLYLSCALVDLLYQQYDVANITLYKAFIFRSKNILGSFMNDMYVKKSSSEGATRKMYKLIINNIIGKFGSKQYHNHVEPIYSENKVLWHRVDDDTNKQNWSYLPLAILVLDYAKLYIISRAQLYYNNLCYIDTDSMHLNNIEDPYSLGVPISNKIGDFKIEKRAYKALYIGRKKYLVNDKGVTSFSMSGLNKPAGVYDQTKLTVGSTIDTLKSYRASGGRIYALTKYNL